MNLHHVVDFFPLLTVLAAVLSVLAQPFLKQQRADRATIAGLERTFRRPHPKLANIAIGSALLSATPGSGVGGDIVDVFELDRRFGMLLVADASGKGIEAAVDIAFIKYTIRTLAFESDGDPAVVLAKFNAMYARIVHDYEAFAVVILGLIDTHTGEVRYASAGHESAFVRRKGKVMLLPPTGPIVGASPYSAYRTESVFLGPGDMLAWATDGMTESRDRDKRFLGVAGLAAWIAAAPNDAAQCAESLVAAHRTRSGKRAQDDVALLVVAYEPLEAPSPLPALRFAAVLPS